MCGALVCRWPSRSVKINQGMGALIGYFNIWLLSCELCILEYNKTFIFIDIIYSGIGPSTSYK